MTAHQQWLAAYPQYVIDSTPPPFFLTEFHRTSSDTYRPMMYLAEMIAVSGVASYLTNNSFYPGASASDYPFTFTSIGGPNFDVDMSSGTGLAVIDPETSGSSEDMVVEFKLGTDAVNLQLGIAYNGFGPPITPNQPLSNNPVSAYWAMGNGDVAPYGGFENSGVTAGPGDIVGMVIVAGHMWFFKNGVSINGSTGYNGAGAMGRIALSTGTV